MYRAPDALLHQVVGGRWRLLEVLGATEHGAAFRVETLEDGRLARLELWDQRHVERRGEMARFEREARTLSRIRHERCLSVVAFGAHEGRPFLVSDLPEGKTLRDAVGEGELTVTRAASLGLQLGEGLRHLHRHGVVHRALRLDNVWVTQSPLGDQLKLGLPRIGPMPAASDAKPERFYLPPERSGARPDHGADLYAAGMALYVMCTGREPAEVVAATTGGATAPPLRAVSPGRVISQGLERVIVRAIAPAPAVRFGTADELIAALESAGVRPTNPKPRPARRPRKRTATVAAAFASVAFLGAVALRSSGGPAPSAPPAAEAAPHPSLAAKATVALPALPRATTAAAAVEQSPQTAPTAAGAQTAPRAAGEQTAQTVPTSSGTTSHGERGEIWSLLDSGRLEEGEARIKPLVAKDPDAAWPHLALGVLYYRKYWRRDSVKQWQRALAQDPKIRRDPQFGAYLCFMLDDTWKAAGVTDLLGQLGSDAAPLLDRCVASAKNARLRALASRALDRRADSRLRSVRSP
jgi:serine/threonine-protein kinase